MPVISEIRQAEHSVAGRLSAFWLGRDPSTFYRWWTAKAIVLFGIRYLLYQVREETTLPPPRHDARRGGLALTAANLRASH